MSKEAMKQWLEALQIGRDYAEAERLHNVQGFKGYEHCAPNDAGAVKQIEDAIKALEEALAKQSDSVEQGEGFFKQIGNQSMMQLWQNYCDVKVERDELQEKLSKQEQGEFIGYISERAAELLAEKKQAHGQIRNYRLFTHDVPLYTTPQPRTWVDLTNEEYTNMWHEHMADAHISEYGKAIGAKLKENNT
jgi:hypothetical protein